jgi:hypothetical protein
MQVSVRDQTRSIPEERDHSTAKKQIRKNSASQRVHMQRNSGADLPLQ